MKEPKLSTQSKINGSKSLRSQKQTGYLLVKSGKTLDYAPQDNKQP